MLIAFILIVIHYIADFMAQTEEMATGKSKSLKLLCYHTYVYTAIFAYVFILYLLFHLGMGHHKLYEINLTPKILWFFPITFVFHTAIDYVSSRITARKFEKKEYYTGIPNMGAFSIIGLDQLFHYGTLFLTYHLLTL